MFYVYRDEKFLAAFVDELDATQFCKHSHTDCVMRCEEVTKRPLAERLTMVRPGRGEFLEARAGYLATLRDRGETVEGMLEAVNLEDAGHLGWILASLAKTPTSPESST